MTKSKMEHNISIDIYRPTQLEGSKTTTGSQKTNQEPTCVHYLSQICLFFGKGRKYLVGILFYHRLYAFNVRKKTQIKLTVSYCCHVDLPHLHKLMFYNEVTYMEFTSK